MAVARLAHPLCPPYMMPRQRVSGPPRGARLISYARSDREDQSWLQSTSPTRPLDDGRIARITLNRPKTRNAQNRGLLVELDDAFLRRKPTTRCGW